MDRRQEGEMKKRKSTRRGRAVHLSKGQKKLRQRLAGGFGEWVGRKQLRLKLRPQPSPPLSRQISASRSLPFITATSLRAAGASSHPRRRSRVCRGCCIWPVGTALINCRVPRKKGKESAGACRKAFERATKPNQDISTLIQLGFKATLVNIAVSSR